MRTMETITCHYCGEKSEKVAAELKRQRKNGSTNFYCNMTCATSGCDRSNHPGNIDNLQCNNRRDEWTPFRTHLRHAYRRNKLATITLQDLKAQWEAQDGRCVLSGVSLQEYNAHGKVIPDKRYCASLDRIDSSKGYIKGNIQFLSTTMNTAKGTLSQEDMIEWIEMLRQ